MSYTSLTSSLTMRPAAAGDASDIARVAQLDSAPIPAGSVLVGIIDDRIVAAISIDDERVVADPFVRTDHLVALLRDRAHAIRLANRTTSAPRIASLSRLRRAFTD